MSKVRYKIITLPDEIIINNFQILRKKNNNQRILFFLLCCLFPVFSYSQIPEPVFHQYSIQEGLPSSEIYIVIQDSKGYLWFGTDNGVSMYDGYTFKNFGLQEGLSDNTVFKIFEDYQGKIWFGTHSCKLSYYFNGSIYSYNNNNIIADTLTKNAILTSFYVDSNDNVYLGLNADGCIKISADGSMEHFNPDIRPHPQRGTMYTKEVDSVLLGYGSADLPKQEGRIVLSGKDLKTIFDLNSNLIARWNLCALKTKNKNCFIALSNYLIRVDENFKETLSRQSKEIICLYEDMRNDVWAGYYKGGVKKINADNSPFLFLEELSVSSILQDFEGGYWFTTLERGAFYVPDISVQQYSSETKLSKVPANTICNDKKGHIYVGLQDGSIFAVSGTDYQITGTASINANNNTFQVLDFLFENPSKLWVGAVGVPITVFNKPKIDNIEIVPLPCSRLVYYNRSIWGGNYIGLYRFNGQQLIYSSMETQPAIRVNDLLPDSFGNFWVGSMDGLWKFNGEKFNYLGDKNSLLQYEINDIKSSSHGLLLATEGAGLVIMNNDSIYSIDTKDGLLSKDINSLYIDESEKIWMATKAGVSMVHFNGIKPVIDNVSERYGLNGLEIADITLNGRDILMAGKTGLKIIRNYKDEKIKYELPVFVTGIQINYNDTVVRNSYDLPYYMNSISVAYKGISYKHNRKLNYKYRLAGLDSVWHSTQNLSVLYPVLPPGSYLFEATVAGNPDYTNKVLSIRFTIHSPFWKAWWFISIEVIVLISLIILVLYIRIQQEIKRGKLSQELDTARHKALSAQMNPHFIFNSLNSIHTYILQNKTEDSSKYLTKFAKLMRMVLENSMKNLIPLEEEINALELYLELEAMRFKGKINWFIDVDKSLMENLKIPPLLLQPYAENAIWHGLMHKEGKGIIKICLFKTAENLNCTIEDDGIGRIKSTEIKKTKKTSVKSAGTNITEKRIGLINSVHNINIGVFIDDLHENGNPCGTRVRIILPLIS